MYKNMVIRAVAAGFIILFLTVSPVLAQERLVRPAFPIGAGEKMIIMPGIEFDSNEGVSSVSYAPLGQVDIFHRQIELPVGSTLKRMLVEVSDNDGDTGAYVRFRLIRFRNSYASLITIREVTTLGYNSSEFTQLVSNPMNHIMQQGWAYYVEFVVVNNSPTNDYKLGVIKIIYEP